MTTTAEVVVQPGYVSELAADKARPDGTPIVTACIDVGTAGQFYVEVPAHLYRAALIHARVFVTVSIDLDGEHQGDAEPVESADTTEPPEPTVDIYAKTKREVLDMLDESKRPTSSISSEPTAPDPAVPEKAPRRKG